MSCSKLKTPISYYGGKQSMLTEIIPLIPQHKKYVEPFFGGGAVFWAKEPGGFEVINDVNSHIINFYEVLKHDFFKLREAIEGTLHSRETYKHALTIYYIPHLFNRVQRAWAFWVCTSQGFASKIGTWGYDREGSTTLKIANKVEGFKEHLEQRLRHTTIESGEAHKVIQVHDSPETFVYADPPYIDTDQGHYGGYAKEHFRRDLEVLASMKGKFLLSTYPSDLLKEFTKKHGWYTKTIEKTLSASNGAKVKARRKKVEVLTANYKI